jgi:hypothetical protein
MGADEPLEIDMSSLTGIPRGLGPKQREAGWRAQLTFLEAKLSEREAELSKNGEVIQQLRGALGEVVSAYLGKQRAETTGLPSHSWFTLEEAITQARGVLEQTKAIEDKPKERSL